MPSTRELRRHIRSVKSTRQITKAMELVAASKMKRAITSVLAGRPYAERVLAVISDLQKSQDVESNILIKGRTPVKKVTLLIIASDRGSVGAFNSLLVRDALNFVNEQQKKDIKVTLIGMGRKAEGTLARLGHPVEQSYAHSNNDPKPADTTALSRMLTARFLKSQTDEVYVLFTNFYSALRQQTILQQLIPLTNEVIPEDNKKTTQQFLYEPDPETVLNFILPRLIDAELYHFVQESVASEHAARRLAMSNASDNASSLIDELQVSYNEVRQSTITQEIAEITGGAAALEGV